MGKAYYWYRPHPYFKEFYPGKVLDLVSDSKIIGKYFSSPFKMEMIKKYFPHGLSPHGLSMLLGHEMNNSNADEPITDIIFELIRQANFPNSPSRLSSLYASESIEQALKWKAVFQSSGQTAESLWEIEFQTNAHLYDATFLNIFSNNIFSYLTAVENAYRYWSEHFSSEPLPELLIPYPAVVVRMVGDANVMSI